MLTRPFELVGAMVTVGQSNAGMHSHRDESYQGGDSSLLLYLTDVAGGETVFEHVTVAPTRGRACVFGVRALHRSEPVTRGDKRIVACEVKARNAREKHAS